MGSVEATRPEEAYSGTDTSVCQGRESLAVGSDDLAALAGTTLLLVDEVENKILVFGQDFVKGINAANGRSVRQGYAEANRSSCTYVSERKICWVFERPEIPDDAVAVGTLALDVVEVVL
jgi:hypothetical protein